MKKYMNFNKSFIGRMISNRLIQKTLYTNLAELREGKTLKGRKKSAHGFKVEQIKTIKLPQDLQPIFDLFNEWRKEKEYDLGLTKNNTFIPTDREAIVNMLYNQSYRLVEDIYNIDELQQQYLISPQVQLLFLKDGSVPGNPNYRQAILMTDNWSGNKAFTLSFAILHDSHFQTKFAKPIAWKEYLRVPHREPFSTTLQAEILEIVTETDEMWAQSALLNFQITGKKRGWPTLLEEAFALRSEERLYEYGVALARLGFPHYNVLGNLYIIWAWVSGGSPRIWPEQKHTRNLIGAELKEFDEKFFKFLVP